MEIEDIFTTHPLYLFYISRFRFLKSLYFFLFLSGLPRRGRNPKTVQTLIPTHPVQAQVHLHRRLAPHLRPPHPVHQAAVPILIMTKRKSVEKRRPKNANKRIRNFTSRKNQPKYSRNLCVPNLEISQLQKVQVDVRQSFT